MTLDVLILIGLGLGAYLIGSLSPSILLAKARGVDIRQAGSGNAGTTNTLRVLGKKAAVITLVVDILKGFLAVLIGYLLGGLAGGDLIADNAAYLCTVTVVVGHVWPVYYHFRGGKGIATAFGALLALNPWLALTALGVVLLGVLIFRRVSVGSLLGALTLPFITSLYEMPFMIGSIVIAVIAVYKHRGNIVRIIKGTEPKLSFKRSGKEGEKS